MTMFNRKEHCKRIASLGGKATVNKHGRQHMAEIGKRGFMVTTCRYFLGNDWLHKRWLSAAGTFNYWQSTGLTMKRDMDGQPIWPESMPLHPAHFVASGQVGLFEHQARSRWESIPF
jgi:general stress protein YciG